MIGKKDSGESVRSLHANAAIANRTHRRLEHFAARRERVVHEDVMLVRDEELYLAKIAIGSRLLGEFVIADIHALPIDLGGVHRVAVVADR